MFALAPGCSAPVPRTAAHLLDEPRALLHLLGLRREVALAFTVRGELLLVPRSVRCRVDLPAPRLQVCRRQLLASMAELERRDPVADEKWIRVHRLPRIVDALASGSHHAHTSRGRPPARRDDDEGTLVRGTPTAWGGGTVTQFGVQDTSRNTARI